MEEWEKDRSNGLSLCLAQSLKEPILGKHFSLPGRTCQSQTIELDTSQSYIAVYTHLKVHPAVMPDRWPTPEPIRRGGQMEQQVAIVEGKPKSRASKNTNKVNK